MADEEESSSGESRVSQAIRKLGYAGSVLIVFVLPFTLLFRTILRNVQKAPFFLSVAIICILGYGWSMLLTSQHWWVLSERFLLGIRPLPNLPLEEVFLYPIGGGFSIFFYMLIARRSGGSSGALFYWAFVGGVTGVFGWIAFAKADTSPYYLYSQLVLYNALCLLLGSAAVSKINIKGLLVSVVVLGAVGFVWDYVAFKYQWWVYFAITGIKVLDIPIEDVNFYLMAPTAAITLYAVLCRAFGVDQSPSNRGT